MNSCFYGVYNEKFEEIIDHWNSKELIKKHIGKIGGNTVQDDRTDVYLKDISEYLFKLPFNSAYEFTDAMVKRMKIEIDNVERNYQSKKIGWFKQNYFVPDAIANYSPVTRVFYQKLNDATNFERNRMDLYLTRTQSISSHIRKALVTVGGLSDKKAKKVLNDLTKLEEKIRTAEGDDPNATADYYNQMQDLWRESGDGVLEDYIKLMEMPKKEYDKEVINYDSNIKLAVDESRFLLDKMGKTLINGLERMGNIVGMLNQTPIMTGRQKNYVEKINKAIDNIKIGLNEGGYFPHYLIDNIVETNYKIRQVLDSKKPTDRDNALSEVVDSVSMMTAIPDPAKGRSKLLNNMWSKNPFYVLTQYSKDVIAFNKINFIQEAYIPTMRRFQKDDSNPEFIRGMREFLEDQFQISTRGLQDRPDWVNNTVRSLMAVETLKSMALSVTGSIRNGMHATYFFAENGIASAYNAVKKYNSHYKEILNDVELEQGFEFGAESGRELIAEGLIPSSVRESDIKYDPIKDIVTYKDKGVQKKLDPFIDKWLGRSLVFHRFTENLTRKWMFRIAWVQAYENLGGKNIMEPNTYSPSANEAQLVRHATKFALRTVNDVAFEYALHAKAKGIRGRAPKLDEYGIPIMKAGDYGSALGELAFQFMHFPMSFANLQAKTLLGAKDALAAGQGLESHEVRRALGFAGIYLAVGALSIGLNADLTNTLENDTVDRMLKIKDYFTLDDEELEGKYRGLVNDFTGPIVGDMLYGLNMMGLLRLPDEHWSKIALGYIDFYEEEGPDSGKDLREKRHFWNRINVELGRWVTKGRVYDALRDGRPHDMIRHELGWWPRFGKQRKTWNERIGKVTGWEPFTDATEAEAKKRQRKVRRLTGNDEITDGEQNLMRLMSELKYGS